MLGGGRFANYNVSVTNQPLSEIAALRRHLVVKETSIMLRRARS
ncbi:MAG: hypothetical protein ACXV76_13300 [Halobacteriota archaeon]